MARRATALVLISIYVRSNMHVYYIIYVSTEMKTSAK